MSNDAKSKNTPIVAPFLGLFFDKSPWQIDPRAFTSCNNVRIQNGRVTNSAMGWTYTGLTFNGPLTMDAYFRTEESGTNFHLLGTPTDIYNFNNGSPVFITPIYNSGTASTVGTAVTGVATKWNTQIPAGVNLRTNA
jgi:hypothetical protein